MRRYTSIPDMPEKPRGDVSIVCAKTGKGPDQVVSSDAGMKAVSYFGCDGSHIEMLTPRHLIGSTKLRTETS